MNSMGKASIILLAITSILFTGFQVAEADELADAGRKILQENKEAVVTIKIVMESRFSMSGSDSETEESKSEITGTVIDPSGLIVASLMQTDPTSQMSMMDFGDSGFSVESELKSAKILTSDGDEIDAEIVLRDNDFDLAFFRPKEKSEKVFKAIDLSNSGAPQQLDPVVILTQLGRVAARQHGVLIDRIEAVVEKPRTFYVPAGSGMGQTALGTPVFTVDGKTAGLLVFRMIKTGRSGMMDSQGNMLMIVIPASDILEVSQQTLVEKTTEERPEKE